MIHERFLLGAVSDHAQLYKQVYNALKPGGWFEIVEMEGKTFSDDGTLPADAAIVKWGEYIEDAFEKLGRPFLPIERYRELLEEAGFVNIEWNMVKRPTNDWPKDPKWKEVGRVCSHSAPAALVCEAAPLTYLVPTVLLPQPFGRPRRLHHGAVHACARLDARRGVCFPRPGPKRHSEAKHTWMDESVGRSCPSRFVPDALTDVSSRVVCYGQKPLTPPV